MASSIVTVERQRKAKTAIQGTTAAKDIVPDKPKATTASERECARQLPENGSV